MSSFELTGVDRDLARKLSNTDWAELCDSSEEVEQ